MYKTWLKFERKFLKLVNQLRCNSKPPIPEECDFVIKIHNETINNPFQWLKTYNAKVFEYIDAENKHANDYFYIHRIKLNRIKSYFQKLHAGLTDETEQLKEVEGKYTYTYLYDNEKLPKLYRYISSLPEFKQLVLDQNELALNTGHVSIASVKISPSEELVAYLYDELMSGSCKCCIVKPTNGIPHTLHTISSVSSIEWLNDDTILYTKKCSQTARNHTLSQINITSGQQKDIYTEHDTSFTVHVSKATSKEFIFLTIQSKLSTEVWYLSTFDKDSSVNLLWSRSNNKEAYIDHVNETFFIMTTGNDGEFCVKSRHHGAQGSEWKTVTRGNNAHDYLQDFSCFSNVVVCQETSNLLPQLRILRSNKIIDDIIIKCADVPGVLDVDHRTTCHKSIAYTMTSPIQPATIYIYDIERRETKANRSTCGQWNLKDYRYTSLEANSEDETQVPISLFHKSGVTLSDAPMVCHVYGSYGVPVNLRFNQLDARLLDDDWIVAFLHVRGGNERGRSWYHSGRRLSKHKTFQDSIAALKFLHANNISRPSKTGMIGRSAGALPIAVLMNSSPHLFSAAVLQVPFLNVLHSMLDQNSVLTTHEYYEWGNPSNNVDDFFKILGYCPFTNLKNEKQVPTYISMSVGDQRVPCWSALQWTAKRRQFGDNSSLICRIHKDIGHYSCFRSSMQEDSEIIAFLEDHLLQ